MAEHSFQVPLPNSPLLLNYLYFGAHFLQESMLTTDVVILAFWLGCVLLPWQRGWLKTRLKNGFCFFKKIPVVRYFSTFFHYELTREHERIRAVETIKGWGETLVPCLVPIPFSLKRLASYSLVDFEGKTNCQKSTFYICLYGYQGCNVSVSIHAA